MGSVKSFIENNFNIVTLIGLLAGLFVPGLEKAPDYLIMVFVACIIFFSCSKVSVQDIKHIDKKAALIFYIVRFVAFPVVVYYGALFTVPDYALAMFLVAMMPVGVTSAAISNIVGGNASFALSATITTSAITPFALPFMIQLVAGQSIDISPLHMLMVLSFTIFIPASLYFGIAGKVKKVRAWVEKETQFYSIFLTGLGIAVLIALQKHYFFEYFGVVILTIVLGCILYALFYVIGWLYAAPMDLKEKKTYAVCSGTSNIALAAGISLLYFSPLTVLFCALAEIPWVLGIAAFKKYSDQIDSRG